jgi:hypothetical protein
MDIANIIMQSIYLITIVNDLRLFPFHMLVHLYHNILDI